MTAVLAGSILVPVLDASYQGFSPGSVFQLKKHLFLGSCNLILMESMALISVGFFLCTP